MLQFLLSHNKIEINISLHLQHIQIMPSTHSFFPRSLLFLPLEIAVFNLWFQFYPMVFGVRFMRPSEVIIRNPKNQTPKTEPI